MQFRVMDGELRRGDLVKFMNTGCEYDITELGVLSPKPVEVRPARVAEEDRAARRRVRLCARSGGAEARARHNSCSPPTPPHPPSSPPPPPQKKKKNNSTG